METVNKKYPLPKGVSLSVDYPLIKQALEEIDSDMHDLDNKQVDATKLEGKTLAEVKSDIDATKLDGKTLAQIKSEVEHEHPYVLASDVLVGSVTNPAANKIAKRDSLGDIHARLFRMQYDTRNANCNLFATLVDTESDNCIRTSTIAQVRAKLGIKDVTSTRGIVGNVRTFYVYPPSGYTMAHLKGFTAVPIYRFENYDYAGNLNVNMYYYYESTRVRVTTASYIKKSSYMAVWIK